MSASSHDPSFKVAYGETSPFVTMTTDIKSHFWNLSPPAARDLAALLIEAAKQVDLQKIYRVVNQGEIDVKVVNLKRHTPDPRRDVLVDRKAMLGNPFYISPTQNRRKTILLYQGWLANEMKKESTKREFERMYKIATSIGINLCCHCVPEDCHAEVIKEYLLRMHTEKK